MATASETLIDCLEAPAPAEHPFISDWEYWGCSNIFVEKISVLMLLGLKKVSKIYHLPYFDISGGPRVCRKIFLYWVSQKCSEKGKKVGKSLDLLKRCFDL